MKEQNKRKSASKAEQVVETLVAQGRTAEARSAARRMGVQFVEGVYANCPKLGKTRRPCRFAELLD